MKITPRHLARALPKLGWDQVPDGTHGHLVFKHAGRTVKMVAPGRKHAKNQTTDKILKVVANQMGITVKELKERLEAL